MRKLALSFSLLLLCQMAVPACRADDPSVDQTLDQFLGKGAPADTAAPSVAAPSPAEQKPTKPKKTKEPKPPKQTPVSTTSSSTGDPSVDKTLDQFLGKGTTSGTGDSSSFVPAPVSAPPLDAGTGDTSSQPDAGSASSSDAMPPASNDSNDHDGITINEEKLSSNTLKAGELNNTAVTALENHEFQKAIDLLKQAIATDPGYVQGKSNLRVAYFNYGVELYNQHQYAEALPYIEKALAISKQLNRDDAEMRSLYEDCKEAVKENAK